MADRKVSDSEDVGTANARADAVSAEQAERDYGRGHTWIRNRAGTINPEPKVSPLIRVYAQGGVVLGGNRNYTKKGARR